MTTTQYANHWFDNQSSALLQHWFICQGNVIGGRAYYLRYRLIHEESIPRSVAPAPPQPFDVLVHSRTEGTNFLSLKLRYEFGRSGGGRSSLNDCGQARRGIWRVSPSRCSGN